MREKKDGMDERKVWGMSRRWYGQQERRVGKGQERWYG